MADPFDKEIITKRRESHGAVMLVGILMAVLLFGKALVAFENLAIFKATAPSTPEKADRDVPAAPL